MENTNAAEDRKEPALHSDEAYSKLAELILNASRLDQDDLRKLKEMEELSIERHEKIDWMFFSIMAMSGLLYGYENGELSFEKMMQKAWDCTLPLRKEKLQFQVMGALSAIALKSKPKERNAKKPPFPSWIKKAIVDLGSLLEETDKELKLSPNVAGEASDTLPSLILKQLAPFNLNIGEGGNHLSEKTIYQWLLANKHENNIPIKNTGRKNNNDQN